MAEKASDGGRRGFQLTHISRTVFSCSSLDFFSSISQSLCWPSSASSRRAMSSTSCERRK